MSIAYKKQNTIFDGDDMIQSNNPNFKKLFDSRPDAYAKIMGSSTYPAIDGYVYFFQTLYGVVVVADIMGLPQKRDNCSSPIFAFHIHEGTSCTGNSEDPFANALTHYNPNNCPHPYHAGDLPPLFGADGFAFAANLTNRFAVEEVIGKTIIIHSSPDDFTTQPSGNAGAKIACGLIVGNK